MIIDFHTHTFPDRVAEKALPLLAETAHLIPQTKATNDSLLESMDQAGIDLSVILPVATNPGQVEKINDRAAVLNKTHQGRLFSAGTMHPEYPYWYDELARIRDLGLKGIKIHPVYQETDIDSPVFLKIIRRAAELGLFVVTHAGDDIGYPGAVRCSPLMCRHVIEETGPFPFILAHMGGWNNWQEVTAQLVSMPVYIDTAFSFHPLHYDRSGTWNEENPALLSMGQMKEMIRQFGSERVLFGSDSPWANQKEYVHQIRSLDLTEDEKENIFHRNAERILNLKHLPQ